MYTSIKNVGFLIELLKQFNINTFVLSAGQRNAPFAISLAKDPFFKCYSVVDERSAAFFALGIARELNRPVGIACTSATASANYYPAIAEAKYQNIPLLVITFDRRQYKLGHLEDQMIEQKYIYGENVKKAVHVPMAESAYDDWCCQRLINEALLELEHRKKGPVHINMEVESGTEYDFSLESLPEVKKINRYLRNDNWDKKIEELKSYKKILVVLGFSTNLSKEDIKELQLFFERFNCAIFTEHMANVNCAGVVNAYALFEQCDDFEKYKPDLIISYGGNINSVLKNKLRGCNSNLKHWLIDEEGEVIDGFWHLTDIFECNFGEFLACINRKIVEECINDKKYYNSLANYEFEEELGYSNFYVAKLLSQKIPPNSLLHLSILNSTRQMQYFKLDKSIKVYSNIGTYGIDGSMSTFLGQAAMYKGLSFLLIGDLSFFYDLNSLRINSIKNNVRIIMVNNGGGAEFYRNKGDAEIPEIDLYTSATHATSAEGWIKSLGYKYLKATNKEELEKNMDELLIDSSCPVFLEVFTDIHTDSEYTKKICRRQFQSESANNVQDKITQKINSEIKKHLNEKTVSKISRIKQILTE